MKYKPLGRTGLFVSELCLGTMTFGGDDQGIWGKIGRLQQEESERIVGSAIEAGINFIDTADVYAGGRSEEITGQALKNLKVRREDVVVATKVFGETGPGPNARGATRSHIVAGLQASLKRLQLEHVDLYQIHGFDPATPIEETVRALDTLVRQGDVRYVGVSNWAAWQIMKALGISERLGLARFESLQAYYTIAGATSSASWCRCCRARASGLMVWSPLAGGFPQRQVRPGAAGRGGQPAHRVRLSAGRQGARLRRDRRDARDRRQAWRLGGADRARLAAAPAGGHERHHRREEGRAARRQHRRDRGRARRRRTEAARRGEPPAGRVPRLDVHPPGRGPAAADVGRGSNRRLSGETPRRSAAAGPNNGPIRRPR
jgi:aryl-alcohol dehydrogenase-like predicted oxidoreductase